MSTRESVRPVLLSFPERFETERLILRAPEFGDGAAVNKAICESISEMGPWISFARTEPSVEETETMVRHLKINYLKREMLEHFLFDKETGEFVGSVGLYGIDWEARKFEIGYWIRTSCAGKGLITEAVEGVTNFVIQEFGANRIEIRCDSRNIRSSKVAERAGFQLEGNLRNYICKDGQFSNELIYAKIRGVEYGG